MSAEDYRRRAEELGVPVIPPIKPNPINDPDKPWDPNPTVSICGECGLEIKRVMGYACGNTNCPCGLGPIMI